jgi:TatD DNase family protein
VLGLFVSFAGNVTYPKALFRELVGQVPQDRLLVETDAPWLAPVPHRGKANEPAFVTHVLQEIALLRGESAAALALATTDNFCRCFPKVVLA